MSKKKAYFKWRKRRRRIFENLHNTQTRF